jgi:hypothetical protein
LGPQFFFVLRGGEELPFFSEQWKFSKWMNFLLGFFFCVLILRWPAALIKVIGIICIVTVVIGNQYVGERKISKIKFYLA